MHAFNKISFQQRSISRGPYQLVARVYMYVVSIEFAYSLMNTPEKRERKEKKRKMMMNIKRRKKTYHPSVSTRRTSQCKTDISISGQFYRILDIEHIVILINSLDFVITIHI